METKAENTYLGGLPILPTCDKERVGEVGGQSVGGVSLSVLQSVWKRLAGNNRAVMEVTVGEAWEAASYLCNEICELLRL